MTFYHFNMQTGPIMMAFFTRILYAFSVCDRRTLLRKHVCFSKRLPNGKYTVIDEDGSQEMEWELLTFSVRNDMSVLKILNIQIAID